MNAPTTRHEQPAQPSPDKGESVLCSRGRFVPSGLHAPFSVLQRTSVRRDASELAACIDVAMRRRPADLVIKGARLFNLATGELERADLAICGERIAAVGEGYEGLETLDATGLTAVPGFVDAHCHIESSLVTPYAWERLVLPHGVTAAVCDPHELSNVGGTAATDFFRRSAAGMLLRLQVQIPSCVPALPTESAGAVLDATAIAPYADDASLAEFMNLPGLLGKAPDALAKLAAFSGRPIDGHAPLAEGDTLNAICAAGLANDHESSAVPEALAKLRRGMTVFIRAGSVARNLADLAPLLTLTLCDRLCLCTDDRDPLDIRDEGHLDAAIRQAIAAGCDPLAVYRAASLSPARHFGWRDRGLLAPGFLADVALLSDLNACTVERVVCRGKVVADAAFDARPPEPDVAPFRGSVRCRALTADDFAVAPQPRVIGVREGSLLTDDLAWEDVAGDRLPCALVARHGTDGRIGHAWTHGFGLKRGAIASTVGHDSHNLCVVGADPADMALAANALRDCGGGFAVAIEGRLTALLPLPIGGLMSDRPAAEVADSLAALRTAARDTGATLANPFLALAFLPLPVIPFARLTLEGFQKV